MGDRSVQRRLAAVLAADVAGYTRLMEQDTDGTVAAWQDARDDIIDPTVASHSGRVVKLTGDGFLVEFATVQNAVNCAIALQAALATSTLDFRMGVNLGDIVDDGRDIHGEGVNIAARIESIADEGGINISGDVYNQVRNRIDASYEDRGEHQVKNVTAPVRVYAIRPKGAAAVETSSEAPSPLEKPSIAVLPFDNLSGDAEQEYFADGMTEDLITDLSKLSKLSVAARHSSFHFKGQMPEISEVATKLGVAYVLEGSVRKMGERLRLNAQLIAARDGKHLWAERYDGEIAEIFDFQDRIRTAIVAALELTLAPTDKPVIGRRRTNNIDAYDLFLKGRDRYFRYTSDANADAIDCFERAIQLDPNFGESYGYLSYCLFADWVHGWSGTTKTLDAALTLAEKGVSLDPKSAIAHSRLGWIRGFLRRYEDAFQSFENALAIEPDLAETYSYYGEIMSYYGDSHKGLELCRRAVELDPYAPPTWHFHVGMCLFELGRVDEAIEIFISVRDKIPSFVPLRLFLIFAFAESGQLDEARAEHEILGDDQANYQRHIQEVWPYRFEKQRKRLLELVQNIGLPSGSHAEDKISSLPTLSDKPSIAVLPFDNLSGDPEQEYFSDGITEDIITALSHIRQFLVIARNTTFTYKGQPVDVQVVARELGVRYVLEGSVRKDRNRVRITAQLIDGTTGNHIWAERFDRDLEDIFTLQDEITQTIVGNIGPELSRAERDRARTIPPENLDAWSALQQGISFYYENQKESYHQAVRLFAKASELDPKFALSFAWSGLMLCRLSLVGFGAFDKDNAYRLSQHAVDLDPQEAMAHFALGYSHYTAGQTEPALAELDESLRINPNLEQALHVKGRTLGYLCRYEEAIECFEAAIKTSPKDPLTGVYWAGLSSAYLQLKQYDEAVIHARKAVLSPQARYAPAYLLSALAHAGRTEEARAALMELKRVRPEFTISYLRENILGPMLNEEAMAHLLDGLAKGGLPEG